MAWKPLSLNFVGCRPLIMHNVRLADPLDEFSKAIHKIGKKRSKTDADHEQLARLEFLGSLWLGEEPMRPVLPDYVVHACLVEGAKKVKGGPAAKAGLFCTRHAPVEYDGPADPAQLWETESFRLRVAVKIGQNRVMRTRPIFHSWRARVDLEYEDSLLDADQVLGFATRAGFEVGLGDWRPRYGRFQAASA